MSVLIRHEQSPDNEVTFGLVLSWFVVAEFGAAESTGSVRRESTHHPGDLLRQVGVDLSQRGQAHVGDVEVNVPDPTYLVVRHERAPGGELVLRIDLGGTLWGRCRRHGGRTGRSAISFRDTARSRPTGWRVYASTLARNSRTHATA